VLKPNSVAIVTGGAGGLGAAVVRRLHADGAAVVVADLADDRGKSLVAELGDRARYVRTDVTDTESVSGAIDAARELGELRYGVIAHGGFGVAEKVVNRDGTPGDLGNFAKTVETYLTGTYNVLRLVSAALATNDPDSDGCRGAVVATASIAAYEGQVGQAAYAAAKAGVVGLTISGARDLSAIGVRFNTIAPGTMKTPIMESVDEKMLAHLTANVPFPKRLGMPAEFADLAAFLLGNGYMNGEVVRLDGAQRFGPK
jgi:NAD(P)-dependent dehydrogenase (short-subunit alcohol dehydrogenase family)